MHVAQVIVVPAGLTKAGRNPTVFVRISQIVDYACSILLIGTELLRIVKFKGGGQNIHKLLVHT